MGDCCTKQYLIWNEGILTCRNCGAEKTGEGGYEELFKQVKERGDNWQPID